MRLLSALPNCSTHNGHGGVDGLVDALDVAGGDEAARRLLLQQRPDVELLAEEHVSASFPRNPLPTRLVHPHHELQKHEKKNCERHATGHETV